MNEITITDKKSNDACDFDTAFRDIENTQKLCNMLMKTSHYQKMGQEGIFAIVAKARGLNISPMDALNGGLYYVQGKVGMSSEMMATLIRKQGHSVVKDAKSTNDICILHGKRADNGDTWIISFSIDDAKRAGLFKNMYEKYPGVMLYNRAMSMLARQLFPDVIKGAGYTLEELNEIAVNKPSNNRLKEVESYNDLSTDVEIIEDKLSNEQVKELNDILALVPEYKEIVLKALNGKNITDLKDVPNDMYVRILNKAHELISLKKGIEEDDT